MKADRLVVVVDCGSTNVRAVVVDSNGVLTAQSSVSNRPSPQPGRSGWLIWDMDELWSRIRMVLRSVISKVGRVDAVIVTTWGADGAPVKKNGELTYPPICWQCTRTVQIAEQLPSIMDPWEIYKITGYQIISFNTLLKLIWLRKNEPKALDEAYTWLMMPGLITHKFTGVFHIEPTSASTMMAMDLAKRDWSPEMLKLADLDVGFFPDWFEPGEIIGYVTTKASEETGLAEGTPVVVGGHDTQFAILGAGVKHGEAVLSSGTWEILAVRSSVFNPSREGFKWGVITEADVEPGLWNPQLLMIASAVLEWVREKLYPELSEGDYDPLVRDASTIPPGSGGLLFIPSFVKDSGPTRRFKTEGTLLGLTLGTSRAQIYRAALEGLSYQLKLALNGLIKSTGFRIDAVRVVGGGSKNRLWNQLRADVTGMPISVNAIREATVFGAALTAFKGIGVYSSFEEALSTVRVSETYMPSRNRDVYINLYEQYVKALNTLKSYYK